MKPKFQIAIILTILFAIISSQSTGQSNDFITVNRVSERVAVFTERSSINNNVIAIQSKKGIVVIDAMCSPITAGKVKELIIEEFRRSDFAYLINTHHDFDHSWGNQAFQDAEIIGHTSFEEELLEDTRDLQETIESNKRHRQSHMDELETNPDAQRNKYLEEYIAFRTRFLDGITRDFNPTPPTITFDDTLSLDLDDIHIKLFYVGPAHSVSDIFIYVQEEEILMTGDVFMDRLFLPYFALQDTLDVPRLLRVLHILLDGEYTLKFVIPGHKEFWEKEKLMLWRDYIEDLWTSINIAKSQGVSMNDYIGNNAIDERILYLKELGHSEKSIENFHIKNIKAFWRQNS